MLAQALMLLLHLAPDCVSTMKESLSDLWGAWVASARDAGSTCEYQISYHFLHETIVPALREKGFQMPSRRSCVAALTANLEPLPTRRFGQKEKEGLCCSFAHLLNLIWAPVLEYMESCVHQPAPEWTEQLDLHHSALRAEMTGVVTEADTPMDIDQFVEHLKATLTRLLQVDVPEALILSVIAQVVPWHASPTPANALHLLRSGLCCKLVGPALAAQANRLILREIADVPVSLLSPADLTTRVRQDLVACLHRQQCGSSDRASELEDPEASERPAKLRRTKAANETTLATKTEQVLHMVRHRVTNWRQRSTIEGACDLLESVSPEHGISFTKTLDELLQREAIRKHLLVLDGALDRCTAEDLYKARESGSFAGVALATDESPPGQPRFRGLRFQITVFYMGTYKPLTEWSSCDDPPFLRSTCLADILHCPGKKGADVARVVQQQLGRLGLNGSDVVAGTGDGGAKTRACKGFTPTSRTRTLAMFVAGACHISPGEPVTWPFEPQAFSIVHWLPI